MSQHSIAITLELQYAQAMVYLNGLYHTYDSGLPAVAVSEMDLAAYESLAKDTALHAQIEQGIPLGKLVL